MSAKTIVLLSVLVLAMGILLYYNYISYKPENEIRNDVKDEKSLNEEEHAENEIQEQSNPANVLNSKYDVASETEGTHDQAQERAQDCNIETKQSKDSVLQSECSDVSHESCLEDLQLLKEKVNDILEKQTTREINTTYQYEIENAIEKLKIKVYRNINDTVAFNDEIKVITETKFSDLSKKLSYLESDNKERIKELSILAVETQENTTELHTSVQRLYAEVEDLKVRMQDVQEQLGAIQNDRKAGDQRINDLQYLIDNRIFPNTFNKDIAVFVFLTVVAIVLFLTFCVYTLRSALQNLRSDIATLDIKLKQVQTEGTGRTDGTGGDQVPGRTP